MVLIMDHFWLGSPPIISSLQAEDHEDSLEKFRTHALEWEREYVINLQDLFKSLY